jgi:hypothetical protein
MFNGPLIGRRLSWYAGAWVGTFVLTLLACLVGPMLISWRLVEIADVVLPPMLLFLAAGTAGVLVLALVSRETLGTKLAVTLLGLLLLLPLLWAPVSGAVVAAFLGGVSIEYSSAYAAFRIVVSRVLFPVYQAIFGGGMAEHAWELFQAASTVVGLVAGIVRLWPLIVRLLGGTPRRAEALDL